MEGDYEDFCGFCGIALTNLEVAADLECTLIDYIEHSKGLTQISLCQECKDRLLGIQVGGLAPALIKRAELDRINNEQKKPPKYTMNPKKKDKDDDGGGGVRPVLPP
jgi:hypothetical protein